MNPTLPTQPHPARIVIFGTPVIPGNRGVMALGASLVDLLSSQHPTAQFAFHLVQCPWPDVTVETRHGSVTVEVITCRVSPRNRGNEHLGVVLLLSLLYRLIPPTRAWVRRRSRWIDSLAEAILVGDIRGGDSFSDIYGLKRFLLATLPIASALLVKGRIVHFPQTYGPFRGRLARSVAKATLRRSVAIVARDTTSRNFAQVLVGDQHTVRQSPDVAFRLQPRKPSALLVRPALPPAPAPLIGLNINGLVLNGGYSGKDDFGLKLDYGKFLRLFVLELLKEPEVHFLLVPHTYAVPGDIESDNHAETLFRQSLPPEYQPRIHEVVSEHDQHEIKGVIGMTEFFMGARMHACIAALSQGIPTVGVAYSRKFSGVFDSVGTGGTVIEATAVGLETALTLALDSYRNREAIRLELRPRVEEARTTLDQIFRDMTRSLGRSPDQ